MQKKCPAEDFSRRKHASVLRYIIYHMSAVRKLYEVRSEKHVQWILLRLLHGERSLVQRYTLRVVQNKTSSREHQGCGGKENDSPVQDVPQALDKKRLGRSVHRNYTQGVERKMETTTVDLTFKF